MLHRLPRSLFQVDALLGFTLFLALIVLGAEYTASLANAEAASVLDARGSHVTVYVRHAALPNYWVLYSGRDLYNVLAAQGTKLYGFLLHTVYNAALSANALGCYSAFVSLFLGTRAFAPRSWGLALCWLPAAGGFLADLCEDLLVLSATIYFPHSTPWVLDGAAWCSVAKYGSWAAMLVLWAIMAIKALAFPSRKARRS